MPRASPRMTMAEKVHLMYLESDLEIKRADMYKGSIENERFQEKCGTGAVHYSK